MIRAKNGLCAGDGTEKISEFRICYLDVENVAEGIDIIRRERVDADGNEICFSLIMRSFLNPRSITLRM